MNNDLIFSYHFVVVECLIFIEMIQIRSLQRIRQIIERIVTHTKFSICIEHKIRAREKNDGVKWKKTSHQANDNKKWKLSFNWNFINDNGTMQFSLHQFRIIAVSFGFIAFYA